jgi:hypothetical protein
VGRRKHDQGHEGAQPLAAGEARQALERVAAVEDLLGDARPQHDQHHHPQGRVEAIAAALAEADAELLQQQIQADRDAERDHGEHEPAQERPAQAIGVQSDGAQR